MQPITERTLTNPQLAYTKIHKEKRVTWINNMWSVLRGYWKNKQYSILLCFKPYENKRPHDLEIKYIVRQTCPKIALG